MATLQYSFSSVSTAGSKVLKVLDNTNSKIYSFPAGTGLIVENQSTSDYNFILTHQNMGRFVINITAINDFATVSPAGNNYKTDYASLVALLP